MRQGLQGNISVAGIGRRHGPAYSSNLQSVLFKWMFICTINAFKCHLNVRVNRPKSEVASGRLLGIVLNNIDDMGFEKY